MGTQLIFVVETDSKCKSDSIYISATIQKYYKVDVDYKIKYSYMGGKYKYKSKEKEIVQLTKQYNRIKGNETHVIYCFDCDDYDRNRQDAQFIKEVEDYCKSKDYEFVWFCKDVESVYLGNKVEDKKKKQESKRFMQKGLINEVEDKKLRQKTYSKNTSNILNVLNKYLHKK